MGAQGTGVMGTCGTGVVGSGLVGVMGTDGTGVMGTGAGDCWDDLDQRVRMMGVSDVRIMVTGGAGVTGPKVSR